MQPLKVTQAAPLLEFLFQNLKAMKKLKVKQLLKHGSVRVNGKIITLNSYRLKPGDVIDFLSREGAYAERLKANLSFKVLYEDDDMIAVDKPAGLLTMGTEDEKEDTLYFELTEYIRAKSFKGEGRVYIVHRLDRDSSGIVIFAKNGKAKEALQSQWEKAIKKYYAIVEGVPAKKTDILESYLKEDKFRRVFSQKSESLGAKHAVTRYRVARDGGGYALLDIQIETGRKNQIRVHLSDIGHPIAGDAKYGAMTNPIYRLALHAYELSVPHPTTGAMITFKSDIPQTFKSI